MLSTKHYERTYVYLDANLDLKEVKYMVRRLDIHVLKH